MIFSRQAISGCEDSLHLLGRLVFLGVLAILFYASAQGNLSRFCVIASVSLLCSGAAIASGGFVGFIFGIPRSRNSDGNESGDEKEKSGGRYRANTNLEQISDWLTKILVGAGLTQITALPGLIQNLAEYASAGMGDKASSVYAGSILIFYFVIGFMYAYLWTRLVLAGAMKHADDELANILAENIAALGTIEQKLDDSDKSSIQKLRLQTEKAIASLAEPDSNARKKLETLSRDYEKIRELFPYGKERTLKMGTIFSQIRSLSQNFSFKPADIIKRFKSDGEGERITAIALAQVLPDTSCFDILTEAVARPKSAFEQYNALKALELVAPKLAEDQKVSLKKVLADQMGEGEGKYINPQTDREIIAKRILAKIG